MKNDHLNNDVAQVSSEGSGGPPAPSPSAPGPKAAEGETPNKLAAEPTERRATIQLLTEVVDCSPCGGPNHLLKIRAGAEFWGDLSLAAGRFVRLRAWPRRRSDPDFPDLGPASPFPLLDRPFSVHQVVDGEVRFLIRKVGPGTKLLTALAAGSKILLTGPLGVPLLDKRPDFKSHSWYLAAGGAGLGPMPAVMNLLKPEKSFLFYGERSGSFQVDESYLQKMTGGRFLATTEDGSGHGQKGLVTEPLAAALEREPRAIFGCGPPGLLKALAETAKSFQVDYVACVEARMACGLGVCLSCSLPMKDGSNFRVCREGPSVDGLSLAWDEIRG
ncbi:MAG: hypothetical protein LBJ64_05160 [Deltaproteobacteria bacterium]|jgi:NAD(P)H-flavin reductase|nr:hypothetical protein [Deltaproteobacteria bacterium]